MKNNRDLEGLAIAVMAVVYVLIGVAVSIGISIVGYFLFVWAAVDHWSWHTVFTGAFWVFAAGVVLAGLIPVYDWAEGVLERANSSE